MIRRGVTHESPAAEPAEDLVAEIFPMLERIGAEIEKMLGGPGRSTAGEGGQSGTAQPRPPATVGGRPPPSLAHRPAEPHQLPPHDLEHPRVVQRGPGCAR